MIGSPSEAPKHGWFYWLSEAEGVLSRMSERISDRQFEESYDHWTARAKAQEEAKEAARLAKEAAAHSVPRIVPERVLITQRAPSAGVSGPPPVLEDLEELDRLDSESKSKRKPVKLAPRDSESNQSLPESKQSLPESKSAPKAESKPDSKPLCGIDGCDRSFGRIQALITHQQYKHGAPRKKDVGL